jgi:TetR/AcrR family transcriptional regulator
MEREEVLRLRHGLPQNPGVAAAARRRQEIATRGIGKRNSARTQARILKAATEEFCRHGLSGARVERIAKRASANMRMLYHYFGGKERLYAVVLERMYAKIRGEEAQLNLEHVDPVEGMVRLADFTFSHFARNPEFIQLIATENMLKGKYLQKSKTIPALTMPLENAIRHLLRRGEEAGVFRAGVDPVQLYVTITAVSYLHVSNRYTLSAMFRKNLADPKWLATRRAHARDVVISYLRARAPD